MLPEGQVPVDPGLVKRFTITEEKMSRGMAGICGRCPIALTICEALGLLPDSVNVRVAHG